MNWKRVFDFGQVPLSAAASVSHEAILLVDGAQNVLALNEKARELFGCGDDPAAGMVLDDLIPTALHAAHREHVRGFVDSGRSSLDPMGRGRLQARRRNGEAFPVEVAVARVGRGPGAEPPSVFVVVLRDLSVEGHLHADAELMRQRVAAVLDAMPAAMWIVDDGRVTFGNRAAATLFGRGSSAELVGRPLAELLGPVLAATLAGPSGPADTAAGASSAVQGSIQRPDGTVREVEVASVALPDHGRSTLQMVLADVTEREQSLRDHRQRSESLRALSGSVVQAREDERKRIARELHDELGQHLSALKLELSSLMSDVAALHCHDRLAQAIDLIDATVASVRRIAADLRPLALDDLGLGAAIEGLARDAVRRLGIEVAVSLDSDLPELDEAAAIALYRIAQEALTNVSRHARATDARIELRRRGTELVLTVRDNGRGFPPDALRRSGRFGLLGARERTDLLGGRFELDNPPGGGGRVTVRLPLRLPSAATQADA